MKISFIRGAYLNNFEGQNYDLPIIGYSSLFPLDDAVPFPVIKLPSIADLQKISFLDKPIKYIANRTLGDSQILFGLEKHLIGSDIVHVADPHYYYSYQAALLKKQGKIKTLISTWWETIPFNNEGTSAKKYIKQFTMNQVDMFICYTTKAHDCLLAEGVREDMITKISLGVDLNRFDAHSKHNAKEFTVLFVGRLVEEKGILDLYEAFKNTASKIGNLRLHIVGSGPLEGRIREMIQSDKLWNKVKIENVAYGEMADVYRNSNVLCVPSKRTNTWEEQLGMVFIEAMASGLPIISYSTGTIPEIVGDAGILVSENDILQLRVSISQLIETRVMREKLGTMGRERAEKLYDSRKTSEAISKLYKTLNSGLIPNIK